MEQQVKDVEERFEGEEKIPVPPFWGGLRIVPTYIEFWVSPPPLYYNQWRMSNILVPLQQGYKFPHLSPPRWNPVSPTH